jgi:hypothetical protein
MEKIEEKGTNNMTGRHPIHQAADKLKKAFLKLGFRIVDNGEGPEVEKADVTFATWKEPKEIFSWQSNPLYMRYGCTILRTRLLPSHIRTLNQCPPFQILAFGRVYQNNKDFPMRHQIEGLVVDNGQTLGVWKGHWQEIACELFGKDATASLDTVCDDAYKISMKNTADGKTFEIGFTGPASAKAMKACGEDGTTSGWVFVIDVDQFALQYFSLADVSLFYENDVNFLSELKSEDPAVGNSPVYTAVDALRKMGYYETCGDTLYPADAYVKMTMIQEAWDKNNKGYSLSEPLGQFTGMRTVITPAMEKIMGLNYRRGVTSLHIFEVGHIYMPIEDQMLPTEHFAVSMGAYGPDVTIESFKKDVITFLQAMGIGFSRFIPTNMATAYKWNECLIVIGKDGYMESNFGRISELAAKNHGIGVPAYFAQFELNALITAAEL